MEVFPSFLDMTFTFGNVMKYVVVFCVCVLYYSFSARYYKIEGKVTGYVPIGAEVVPAGRVALSGPTPQFIGYSYSVTWLECSPSFAG